MARTELRSVTAEYEAAPLLLLAIFVEERELFCKVVEMHSYGPTVGGGDMASANVLRKQQDEIFALLAVTDKRHENYLELERMRHKMQPDFRKKRYV
ncbi:hypothetical protein MTO96_043720 [Rhipicephalus appendiculatus]